MSTSLDIIECVFIRFCLCSKTKLNNIRRLFELNSVSYLIVDNQKWFSIPRKVLSTKLISNMAYHEIHKSSSHLDMHSRIQHIENLPLICSVCCWPCLVCAGRFRISRNYPSRSRSEGRHAIHSSNIFQHVSSGAANCESSATFGNQSQSQSQSQNLICASRGNAKLSPSGKWQVAGCAVRRCMSVRGAKSVQLKI